MPVCTYLCSGLFLLKWFLSATNPIPRARRRSAPSSTQKPAVAWASAYAYSKEGPTYTHACSWLHSRWQVFPASPHSGSSLCLHCNSQFPWVAGHERRYYGSSWTSHLGFHAQFLLAHNSGIDALLQPALMDGSLDAESTVTGSLQGLCRATRRLCC